jgi:hypothetical protein
LRGRRRRRSVFRRKVIYSGVRAHRNTAWISASYLPLALETRWLGVRETCGVGLFYRNCRSLFSETGWLGAKHDGWVKKRGFYLLFKIMLRQPASIACALKGTAWLADDPDA